jgi:opacity protein-like surface antigen
MSSARRPGRILTALLTTCLLAEAASAAELFVAGRVGISNGEADGTGLIDSGLVAAGSGSDDDSSPIYGTALGLAVPLSDVIPWALRFPSFDLPYWPGRSLHFEGDDEFRFPGWRTLFEVEALFGRNYDFATNSGTAVSPWHSEVTSRTFMANARLDVPLRTPLTALFGRMPMLEPLTLYGGGGAGASWNEIEASGPFDLGDDTSWEFAWQAMAGFGYAVTDTTHLSLGWRYLDLGEVDLNSVCGAASCSFEADTTAHEVMTSVRFEFYHVPFFGRE